jgi:hypothetical protein
MVKPMETLSTYQPSLFSLFNLLDTASLINWVIRTGERQRLQVCTPFCSKHNWTLWQIRPLSFGAWLSVNTAIAAGVTITLINYDVPTWAVAIGLAFWIFFAGVWAATAAVHPIPVLLITGEVIRLKVHPDYADAVRQRQLERAELRFRDSALSTE